MMKIGCGTVLFRKFELERSLAAMRDIGFEYFETQAVGPWCPHVNVDEDDPENLVRLQKKYGFKAITGLWSKDGNIIANPNAVESGIRTVEFAAHILYTTSLLKKQERIRSILIAFCIKRHK